jgi:type IV pilus assembly protein PilA
MLCCSVSLIQSRVTILFYRSLVKITVVTMSNMSSKDSAWGNGETMRKENGFSLIELLIVVAIILIIAAIAIPNLLRARIAANESSAVSSIRTINTAQISYQSSYPTVGYAGALGALGPAAAGACGAPTSTNACLIDYAVSSASTAAKAKSGYYFTLSSAAGQSYEVGGSPAVFNQSGVRNFCSVEDGVVRFNNSGSSSLISTSAACVVLSNLN